MQLPDQLREALAASAQSCDPRLLAKAAEQISIRYRQHDFSTPVLRNDADRIAYALTRMPATYAANRHVFEEVARLTPDIQLESLLDLGAGTGAAGWAATEVFPGISHLTLVERDPQLVELGRAIASRSDIPAWNEASWITADVATIAVPASDLIVISYALGELPSSIADSLISRAWSSAKKMLVVIEPGTTRGFESVLKARNYLLEAGSHLIAPCPHHNQCPMAAAGDWCHFAQRVQRTAEHRRLKTAELGYEDEKFSYVAASKSPLQRPHARVVRHPLIRPGHIQLTLCTAEGLQTPTIGKSHRESFRRARKTYWGAPWE